MKLKSILNRIMLLLILLFSGFVFWLGLENIKLQENSYGIVYTKISGWSDSILISGKFSWNFEKVIPGNYTVHIFKIEKQDISYTISENLPSSDLYATFNSINSNNFEYSYNLTGSIKFNPDYLSKLTANGTFTRDSFNSWQQKNILEIQNILKNYIKEKIADSETITINGSAGNYISELFPHFYIYDIFININSPDMELYNNCRNRYLQNLTAQTSADKKYLIESLNQQNEEKLRLNLLKQYGEVFTTYPIMIEYLKIDQGMTLNRAVLEDFIAPRNQK